MTWRVSTWLVVTWCTRYKPDEDDKQRIGCIAATATKAHNHVKQNVERKGKKKHHLTVSRRGPTVRVKTDGFKRDRTPKGIGFWPCFIRDKEVVPSEYKVKREKRDPPARNCASSPSPPKSVALDFTQVGGVEV